MRRIVPLVLVAILTLIGSVASTPALTAQALELRNPPTSPGALYGVPMTGLPVCAQSDAMFPVSGGWAFTRNYTSTGAGYPDTVTGYTSPRHVRLGEPCNVGAGTNNLETRIRVPWTLDGLTYTQAGTANSADIVLGCAGTYTPGLPLCSATQQTLRCGTSEWTAPGSVATRSFYTSSSTNLGGYPATTSFPLTSSSGVAPVTGSFTGCSHLIDMKLRVCIWNSNLNTDSVCYAASWSAETQFNARPYIEEDPELVLCTLDPTYADCAFVLEGVDGTDFNAVCAYPPVWDGDFLHFGDWFVLMVGHYSKCLFQPVNGWDREGLAQRGYDEKIVPAQESIETLFTSWAGLYEGCGVVAQYSLFGNPIVIDTCQASWVAPFKNFWRVVVMVLSLLVIAFAVLTVVTNLFRSKDDLVGQMGQGE